MKIIKPESNIAKKDFKRLIKTAEKSPTMTLEEFNRRWKEKELKIKRTLCRPI